MVTCPASQILRAAANMARLTWPGSDAEFANLVTGLDLALDTAWRDYPWPELCRLRARTLPYEYWTASGTYTAGTGYIQASTNAVWLCVVAAVGADGAPEATPAHWVKAQASWDGPDYDATTGAQQGDIVSAAGTAYYCHTTAPAGTALSDTAYFVELTELDLDFPKTDAAAPDTMDDVFSVYAGDPRPPTGADPLSFQVIDDAVRVWGSPATAWFHYRLPRPLLTGDRLNLSLNYASGDQVYWQPANATGDFYTATETVPAGETPSNTPAKWAVVELPRILLQALTHGTHAHVETCQGQGDRAVTVEMAMRYYLDEQIRRLEQQQNQRTPLTLALGPVPH